MSGAERNGVPGREPLPVVVLGSLNMDLVLTATQIPRPGETVLAGSLTRMAGGKGANQAVAGARLGADVTLIGRFGDDHVAQEIRGDLAPFHELPDELLRRCAYLIVNRNEAGSLTGSTVRTRGDAVAALEQLVARGARGAVVTLGSQGCLAQTDEGLFEIAAYEVPVVDTTGAGGAFVGAFAAALASQARPEQALRFAAAAGAVTCRVAGAQQDGLSYGQVQELIREQPGVGGPPGCRERTEPVIAERKGRGPHIRASQSRPRPARPARKSARRRQLHLI